MKKILRSYLIIWLILLAMFNLIVFITPSEYGEYSKFGGGFWIGYIFITIEFLAQLVTVWIATKDANATKLFYNIPLIRVSYISLLAMMFVGTLCMVIPNIPNWIGIILCAVVLVIEAIAFLLSQTASTIVEDIDNKIKNKTFFIKLLTLDLDSLKSRATSDEVKREIDKVYQAVRYSDPMSNEALVSIESQLQIKYEALAESVSNDNLEKVMQYSNEFLILLKDRNNKCKLLK